MRFRIHTIIIHYEVILPILEVLMSFRPLSPLMCACQTGNQQRVIELLRDQRVDINEVDQRGLTAFHYACRWGKAEVVKLMINSTRLPDINKADAFGNTPLDSACSGYIEIVKLLLNSTRLQDINGSNASGKTPLHTACEGGHTDIAKLLINAMEVQNLDIDKEDNLGRTPLISACAAPQLEKSLIQLMLQHGARLTHKDSEGKTALDCACENEVGREAMEAILEYATEHELNINTIVSTENYSKILEFQNRFQKQLEQANEYIRTGEQLLEKKSEIKDMNLQAKKKYLSDISTYLSQIEASHILNLSEPNNLPGFTEKAALLTLQVDDLEQIQQNIEKELREQQRIAARKLTHRDLLQLGNLLGYPIGQGGLCQGFSAMLTQAWLANDSSSFFSRLKFIEMYNKNFDQLKKDIEDARERAKTIPFQDLDEDTIQLLEIPAFYEGIELFLNPSDHKELLNQYASQFDVEFTAQFTRPVMLNENEDMAVVLDISFAFDRQELLAYLTDLEAQLENTAVTAPVFFSSIDHSICARYDKDSKLWTFVDTNDFFRYPNYSAYYEIFDKAELVDGIFQSFNDGPSSHAIFTTQVVAKRSESAELRTAFDDFDKRYPVTAKLVDKKDDQNLNLLSIACRDNQIALVVALLKLDNINVNQENKNGNTPLHLACQNGNLLVVKALLDHPDIEVNRENNYGGTPLYMACLNGHIMIVKELLSRPDIDVNKGFNEINPLYCACVFGRLEIVKELLKHDNIRVNDCCPEQSPLGYACANGKLELVRELLKHKDINIHAAGSGLRSPIEQACYDGHFEIVKLLADKTDSIDVSSTHRMTPLLQACDGQKAKKELIQFLLQEGASITHHTESGATALDLALASNNKEAIEAILEHASAQKLNLRSILSNTNYPKIQEYIRLQEQQQRFQKQLEQAKEYISENQILLGKKSQMAGMSLEDKQEYRNEITRQLNLIEDIFDLTEENDLPDFIEKSGVLNLQREKLNKIKQSIEKELDNALRAELSKLTEKYLGRQNDREGVLPAYLKELEQTYGSSDTPREYINKLETVLQTTTLSNFDELLALVDSGVTLYEPEDNEFNQWGSIWQELREDIIKLQPEISLRPMEGSETDEAVHLTV
jgi:ankyrin repeat protein